MGDQPYSHVRVARNSAIQLVARIANLVLSIVTVMVMARALGLVGYGTYGFVFAYVFLWASFADPGLHALTVREMCSHPEEEARIWGVGIAARLALSFVLALAAALATFVFVPAALRLLVGASCLAIALSGCTSFLAIAQTRQRGMLMSVPAVVQSACWLLVVIVLALQRAGAAWFVGGAVAMAVVSAAVSVAVGLRLGRPRMPHNVGEVVAFVRRALPVGAAAMLVSIYYKIDATLLYLLAGAAPAGLYNAAYKVLDQVQLLPSSVASAVLPAASRGQADEATLRTLYRRSTRYLISASIALIVGAWMVGPQVIELLFGPEFRAAAPLLNVLVLATFSVFSGHIIGTLVIALGAYRSYFRAAATGAIVNVVLNLAFIPRYGAMAAAVTTVVTELLVSGIMVVALWRRNIGVPDFGVLPKALGAALLMGLILRSLQNVHVLVAVAVGAAVFVACSLLVRIVTVSELKKVFVK